MFDVLSAGHCRNDPRQSSGISYSGGFALRFRGRLGSSETHSGNQSMSPRMPLRAIPAALRPHFGHRDGGRNRLEAVIRAWRRVDLRADHIEWLPVHCPAGLPIVGFRREIRVVRPFAAKLLQLYSHRDQAKPMCRCNAAVKWARTSASARSGSRAAQASMIRRCSFSERMASGTVRLRSSRTSRR